MPSNSTSNPNLNRSQRCGVCRGCQSKPCGLCTYCQDSPQFGGPGVKKQSCIERRCLRVLENRLQRDAPTFKAKTGCNRCDECRGADCQICLVCLDRRFFENRYMTGAMCAKKRCNNARTLELTPVVACSANGQQHASITTRHINGGDQSYVSNQQQHGSPFLTNGPGHPIGRLSAQDAAAIRVNGTVLIGSKRGSSEPLDVDNGSSHKLQRLQQQRLTTVSGTPPSPNSPLASHKLNGHQHNQTATTAVVYSGGGSNNNNNPDQPSYYLTSNVQIARFPPMQTVHNPSDQQEQYSQNGVLSGQLQHLHQPSNITNPVLPNGDSVVAAGASQHAWMTSGHQFSSVDPFLPPSYAPGKNAVVLEQL